MFRTLLLALLALPAVSEAAAPPTVAILYFDYDGEDAQMKLLAKGLAQMLISDLSGRERYTIVERERLQAVLDELELGRSKKIDRKTAAKIGKLLGAKYLVLGSYFDVMGMLRMDARVVAVETGAILGSAGSNGVPDTFIDLEQALAAKIGRILEDELPAQKEARPSKRRPKPPKKLPMKTALTYAKALDAKDRGDRPAAKKHLEAVVKAEPDFSLAQLDLGAMVQ